MVPVWGRGLGPGRTAGGKWAAQDAPSCHIPLSGSVFVLRDSGGNKPLMFLFRMHLSHFLLLSFLIQISVIPCFSRFFFFFSFRCL